MVNRKPKGWDAFEDSIPFVRNMRNPKTPKVVKESLKVAGKAGKTVDKAATGSAKYVFGDPKKGWQDVAKNSAMLVVPYSKIGKGAKAVVKNRKVIGKAASGLAQGATAFTVGPAADKLLSKTKKKVGSKKTLRKGK